MVVISPLLMGFLNAKFQGITLFPFIFLKRKSLKYDRVLLNHEKIHLRQQLEMGILPFYCCYLGEFCYGLWKHKNGYKAYRSISFEQEAYAHEHDLGYLSKRRRWAFRAYGHQKATLRWRWAKEGSR